MIWIIAPSSTYSDHYANNEVQCEKTYIVNEIDWGPTIPNEPEQNPNELFSYTATFVYNFKNKHEWARKLKHYQAISKAHTRNAKLCSVRKSPMYWNRIRSFCYKRQTMLDLSIIIFVATLI